MKTRSIEGGGCCREKRLEDFSLECRQTPRAYRFFPTRAYISMRICVRLGTLEPRTCASRGYFENPRDHTVYSYIQGESVTRINGPRERESGEDAISRRCIRLIYVFSLGDCDRI